MRITPKDFLQSLQKIAPKLNTNTLLVLSEHDYANNYDENHLNIPRTKSSENSLCDKCGKILLTSSLKDHTLRHLGEKPYICESCGKRFVNTKHLKIHSRQHTGEKPFACTHCDKRFSTTCVLKIHIRRHTGEKPFSCTLCNKKFVSRTEMLRHKHSNHNIVTKDQHMNIVICEICNKKYKTPYNLQRHMKLHKDITCKICKKSFSHLQYLKTHYRVHTKEKPYTCNLCQKSFAQKSALNAHQKFHLGERPYACKYCNKTFVLKSDLKVHLRTYDLNACKFQYDECDNEYTNEKHLLFHKHKKHFPKEYAI